MKPLQDVRIISIEQYGAGPYGSLHLADLGAEIIKIEDPNSGGDVARYIPPYAEGEDSLFFETFNRNKRSLSLDIRSDAGRKVFEDLVRVSDAVYSNLRGDVPAALKLTYADLDHLNPRIVCCSLSGYGQTGPRAADPGYDYLLQGLVGWMDITGEPAGPPTKTGLSVVDFSGGLAGAIAVLAGIHAARRDGVGMDCDLSLFEVALSMLSYLATWHLNTGHQPARTRHSAHPSLVPFQNFQTKDAWIVVACAKEKFWRLLTKAIGRTDLANDERFATFADRARRAHELTPILEAAFRTRSSADWLARLHDAGVPCAPVNTVADALNDEQTIARGAIVNVDHPRWGAVQQLASPVHVGPPDPRHRRAPRRNEDFEYIVRDLLGYKDATITGLTTAGAFGQ
ncbi:CaiB/BaiF CoA transferase family protein [Phytoactinopolyspora mesophila]|uniref:CoA transferase n=1 Tax=Phytoactinopolyspora mesophila TaxID=2650750 RepID=A0A7K3MCT3_9ACTN|nr:CoA transferase [Phytoactinopolyspora mesophila]NDL61103.1 CoA transferase [Phytoactinopolyspora mesophila]